jgi:hypothetical protein
MIVHFDLWPTSHKFDEVRYAVTSRNNRIACLEPHSAG